MKIEGLARLNKSQIEGKTVEVLNYYRTDYFRAVQRTPLEKIVTNLAELHSISYNNLDSLGWAEDGQRILGCFVIKQRAILIDASLKNNIEKFHFVLAHELGHLVLHRNVIICESDGEKIIDTDVHLNEKKRLTTDLDFLEWQANYFAGAILLPKPIFKAKLDLVRREIGIPPGRNKIYVDNQQVNITDYYETVRQLSEYFQVSKTVVEIRLKELDLIEDHRFEDMTSIGEILRRMNR